MSTTLEQYLRRNKLKGKFIFPKGCFSRTHNITRLVQWGGSPGLVVMGGDSCSKGPEFESRHHILNGHDIFTFICCKKCNDLCLKRRK